jgi:hypothetical protein
MNEATTNYPPISDRSGVTDAVRTQILATEHWSLLATRSMTWNDMFSRASMFITLLSATIVALALVGQATGFGQEFRVLALLLLPLVLLMGLATVKRLGDANFEDYNLVVGMNRLRHAYLELAPELEPYFTTGHTDDVEGILRSLGWADSRVTFGKVISGMANLVVGINAVVAGVFVALIAEGLGARGPALVVVGVAAGLAATAGQIALAVREIREANRRYQPRFPR